MHKRMKNMENGRGLVNERSGALAGTASEKSSKRILTSLIIAVGLHAALFAVVQWLLPVEEEFEYTGPIYVTIEEYEPEILRAPQAAKPVEIETAAPVSTTGGEARQTLEPAPQTPPVEIKPRLEPPVSEPVTRTEESYLPETTERAEDSFPEGVRSIIIPAEKETLPAGLEAPILVEKTERASFPPAFIRNDEDERPLYLDHSKLDDVLVTDDGTAAEGETGPVGEGSVSSAEEGTYRGGPVITLDEAGAGRALISPITDPKIPAWVEKEGLRLRVVASFSVTSEGHTTPIRVERSSGYPDVDAAVLEIVRKLKFTPVTEDRTVRGRIDYLITPKKKASP